MTSMARVSERAFRVFMIMALLVSISAVFAPSALGDAGLDTVTSVDIDSPTGASPVYRTPSNPFTVQYDAAGNEVVTANYYLTTTVLFTESISLPVTDRTVNLTIPAGTADGKYNLKVELVGTSTKVDTEAEAVIVDTVTPTVAIDPIDDCLGTLSSITGTANDASAGVASVDVKIQNSDGDWWDGSAWVASETWDPATWTTTWSYAAPTLEDSKTYTVTARATDGAGNETASGAQPTDTFTVDQTAPDVVITDPPTGWENAVAGLAGTATDVGYGCGDVASVEVQVYNVTGSRYWNGSIWTASASWNNASGTTAWTYTMPALTSGRQYQVTAKATDTLGNADTDGPYTFDYDDVDPTVAITTPDAGTEYYTAMPQFAGTAGDDASGVAKVEVKLQRLSGSDWWDGSSWVVTETVLLATGTTAWTYDASTVPYSDTVTYEVSAKSTDNAGNDPWVSDQFTIDTTAPSATIDGIADEVGCTFVEIGGGSSDATSGVDEVYVKIKNASGNDWWDGSGWGTETWLLATGTAPWTYDVSGVTFGNGDSYQVWAKAVDNVGLETASGGYPTDTFTYDECPTVAITAPAADANVNTLAEITGTAGDAEAVVDVQVKIDTGAWSSATDTSGGGTWATWSYDASSLGEGTHTVYAQSKDDFGQWSAVVSRDFTLDTTAPSVTIDAIADPSQPTEFAGTASDTSSGVAKVEVKVKNNTDADWWQGGSTWGATESWREATGTTTWTIDVSGAGLEWGDEYTVWAKAEDNAGNEMTVPVSRTFTYGDPNKEIALGAGWNLISLPLIPDDTTIEVVLADLIDAGTVDWADSFFWESGVLVEKKWDLPIRQLTTMEAGQGYWVSMFGPDTLVNDGMYLPAPPQTPSSYDVYAGWNMIGYHATTATALVPGTATQVGVYLGDVAANVQAMYYYEGGAYNAVTDMTQRMKPGYGYWMALSADGTIYP